MAALWLLAALVGARAATSVTPAHQLVAGPAGLCQAAISVAEATRRIPDAFLSAIARVESGRPDAVTGSLEPWPWTINAEGTGSFFGSKAEAIAAVRALQARGVKSIDVGCLQVNLQQHPEAFANLEQAFDPASNAQFAAGFLAELFGQMHSWPRAAAAYHSQTPNLGTEYQRRVLAEWAVPDGQPEVARAVARAVSRPANLLRGPVTLTANLAMGPAGGGAAPAPVFGPAGILPVRTRRPAGVLAGGGRDLAAYRQMPTQMTLRKAQLAVRKAG